MTRYLATHPNDVRPSVSAVVRDETGHEVERTHRIGAYSDPTVGLR
jgi:hypothetical protein